jgi:hypothetical protein
MCSGTPDPSIRDEHLGYPILIWSGLGPEFSEAR